MLDPGGIERPGYYEHSVVGGGGGVSDGGKKVIDSTLTILCMHETHSNAIYRWCIKTRIQVFCFINSPGITQKL